MIALSPHTRLALPEHTGMALVIVYQIGLFLTAVSLSWGHWDRCSAIFNCMVQWAADLFRAIFWPLYWFVQLAF